MSNRDLSSLVGDGTPAATKMGPKTVTNLHQRTDSSSSKASSYSSSMSARDLILLTPCPVEPGHTLITIIRLSANEWKPEMRANAAFVAEGDNAGIIINKPANIMDYNKVQAGQKERLRPPSAKMSFKVFLTNPDTNKLTLEHRTLRFWLDQDSSQIVQAYFCQLIGNKPDDFPKNYVGFLMKLMRILKDNQFGGIVKMEVELRQLAQDDSSRAKPPSPVSSIDGSQSGRGSPLTSQRVLDLIESSYPNPISIKEICSSTQTDEAIVRQLVDELAIREKINSTDDGQHFTRTTKPIDTKVNMVKQMPKVNKSQQPVIAIITAQYCEKLAVDTMISDKETFVRYRVSNGQDSSQMESSSNYVYTLGNIGDHRVVSTKLTSVGHSRGALIAAGNATTRLLGTFPEIEFVFMVGCGGGVANYTNFASHVRLGDIVVSHLPGEELQDLSLNDTNLSHHNPVVGGAKSSSTDFVYVHCRPKQQDKAKSAASDKAGSSIPVSYSVHKNLKRAVGGINTLTNGSSDQISTDDSSPARDDSKDNSIETKDLSNSGGKLPPAALTFDECHFRLWRPVNLDLQKLAQRLWAQGLDNATQRIWNYYIDEGIESLKQQEIDATRPTDDTDKLYMSIGMNDTIEVNHPEPADDEIDLRQEGRPMCHFGPIGSGRPALASEQLKQQMISEFNLRAFDSEFDPVVESIYGNRKERYIMIRGISDYKDGRKKKEWQQYSALVAAAFMKSIIVNLKPLD